MSFFALCDIIKFIMIDQGAYIKSDGGQKKWAIPKVQNVIFSLFKGCIYSEKKLKAKKMGFAGHIWHVVHACVRPTFGTLSILFKKLF